MHPESFFIRFEKLNKARVGLRKDGIVQTDIFEEQELSLADVKEIIEVIGKLAENQMMPQLIIAEPLSGPDLKAMQYIASEGSSPYAIAEAYVITSLSQKILAKFYLNFNKPSRPTKIYGDEAEAVKWLKEQTKQFRNKKGLTS
jgi:hypothetical protein